MSWLSKKFEELTAQINPFDGGKTASTVRANRVQPPPAQTRSGINVGVAKPQQNINVGVSSPVPKVSVVKPIPTPSIKVGDVSVAQSPTMTNKSESYQAPKLSNKIVDIGKSIGSGIVEAPKYLSTGIAESLAYNTDTQKNLRQAQANLQDINTKNIANASRIVNDPTVDIATKQRYAKLLDHQVQTADQNFNQANQRNQEIQQRTDPVKGGASVASLGLDVATLGVGAGATQLLKQAGKQGTKQLTTRLVKESAKTAGVGAGAGAISPFVSNGSDTGIKDVAIGAGLGAGIGGALPGVGYGLSKTIKPTTNLVKGAYKSFNSLGEDGFIQAGPTPKKIHPEDQAIMADFIDKSRGIYRPDERTAYQLDLDASRIAERYGIDPGVNKNINPVTRLADAFDSRLQTEGFGKPDIISKAKDVAKKIWPSDEGGGMNAPKTSAEARAMFGPKGRFSKQSADSQEALKIEARKYKTAEEFLRAQNKDKPSLYNVQDEQLSLHRGANDVNTKNANPDRPIYHADTAEYAETYGKASSKNVGGRVFTADSSQAYGRINSELRSTIAKYLPADEWKKLPGIERTKIEDWVNHTLEGERLSAQFNKPMPEVVKKAFDDLGIDYIRIPGDQFRGTVGKVGHQTEIIEIPKPKGKQQLTDLWNEANSEPVKKPKTGVNDTQLKEIQKAKKSVIDVATDEIYNNQPKDNLISQVLKNGGISSTAYETYPKGVIRSKGLSADRMAQVLGYPDENSLMDALNNTTKPLTRKEIKENVIKDLESGSHPYSADYKQMLDAEVKRSDELSLYPKGTYREVKVNNKPPKSLSDEDFASLADTPEGKSKGFILRETKPKSNGSKVILRTGRDPETGKLSTYESIVDKDTDMPFKALDNQTLTDKLKDYGHLNIAPKKLDKKTNKELVDLTSGYLGNIQAKRTANVGTARSLPKLSDNESLGLIDAIENGTPISDFKNLPQNIRNIFDNKYRELTDAGVDIGYLQNYFPHRWIDEEKVRKTYQSLNLKAGIQNPRDLPTIKEGIELGFKPSTTDYRSAVADYLNTADRLLENRKYFDQMKKQGFIFEAGSPPQGMQVIDAPGLPKPRPFIDNQSGLEIHGNYYAEPSVAKKLNRLYGDREPTGIFEKGLDKTAKASRFVQDVGLSGGVPFTPINAFTVAQTTKEILSGNIKNPLVATMKSFSKEGYSKYIDKNKGIVQSMQRQGVPIRDDYNLRTLGDEITNMIDQTGQHKNKISKVWDKVFTDPTFKRFMPALQVEMYKKVYNKQVGKVGVEKAEKIAGDAVANFYGLNKIAKDSFRNKAGTDTATTLLFAPRYRESMVNFWVNNLKSIPNITKPEYKKNLQFIIGAGIAYGAMNYLNELGVGNSMFDNPDGKKDKLLIPQNVLKRVGIDTGGKDIGVPFLSSIATVPRYATSAVLNLGKGNAEQFTKDVSGFMSFGLRPLMDAFVNNEDYFGDKIVSDGASPIEAMKDRGSYLLAQYNHPYLREGLRTLQGKNKSLVEGVSRASELPTRFYDPRYYQYDGQMNPRGKEGEIFTLAEQRNRADIKKQINSISENLGLNKKEKAMFESMNAVEFDDNGDIKQSNDPFYKSQRATNLQNDKVFEAMKQKAQFNNKLNGQPIDPIYSVTPSQRKLLLWKDTLPQGTTDPSIKAMYNEEWYQDFRASDSQYYKDKQAWNDSMGYKQPIANNTNPYPEASAELQQKLDFYNTLPKGTGARSAFLRVNPDILEQWDKVENWKNGERSRVGLGPIEDSSNYSGSYGSGRSGGRKSGLSYKVAGFGDTGSTNKSLRQILQKAVVESKKSVV